MRQVFTVKEFKSKLLLRQSIKLQNNNEWFSLMAASRNGHVDKATMRRSTYKIRITSSNIEFVYDTEWSQYKLDYI